MKKIVFFLLTAITVTSCSSDDNSSPTPIIGPEVQKVDFTGKKAGDELVLTSKEFTDFDEQNYKILFVKKVPESANATKSTNNSTRALPPNESNEDVEAFIRTIEKDKLYFIIPGEAGTGDVKFKYKNNPPNRIGNFIR